MWAYPEPGRQEERVARTLHWFERVGVRSACKRHFLKVAIEGAEGRRCVACESRIARQEYKDGLGKQSA